MKNISSFATGLITELVLSVSPWLGIPALLLIVAMLKAKALTELLRVCLAHRVKNRELNIVKSSKDLSPKQAQRVQETLKALHHSTLTKEP